MLPVVAITSSLMWAMNAGFYRYDVQYKFGSQSEIGSYPQYIAIVIAGYCLVHIMYNSKFELLRFGLVEVLWLFALISISWSIEKYVSLIEVARLLSVMVIYYYIVEFFRERILKYIFTSMTMIFILSFSISISGSTYGIMLGDHAGLWRGIFPHKNVFGIFLFIYACVTVYYSNKRFNKLWKAGVLILIFITMVMSSSITAMLLSICFLGVALYLEITRHNWKLGIIYIAIISASCFIAWFSRESIFALLGRDSDFTGRSEIWGYFWEFYKEKIWTGTGFGTQSYQYEIIRKIRYYANWNTLGTPHNSYIYILGECGVSVLILFLILNIVSCYKTFVIYIRTGKSEMGLLCSLIVILSIYRWFESSLTFGVTIGYIINIIASFMVRSRDCLGKESRLV